MSLLDVFCYIPDKYFITFKCCVVYAKCHFIAAHSVSYILRRCE